MKALPAKISSWIIVRKSDSKAICETWDRVFVAGLNTDRYEAIDAYTYLVELNRKVKAAARGGSRGAHLDL